MVGAATRTTQEGTKGNEKGTPKYVVAAHAKRDGTRNTKYCTTTNGETKHIGKTPYRDNQHTQLAHSHTYRPPPAPHHSSTHRHHSPPYIHNHNYPITRRRRAHATA